MGDDWPLYDALGPQGDWPGGRRYGLRRDAFPRERQWTADDHALATWFGIDLPGVDLFRTETWMDQRCPVIYEMVLAEVDIGHFTDSFEALPRSSSYEHRATYAKKYGRSWWATPDPFVPFRPADPEPPIRVVSMVGRPLHELGGAR